ncbi:MAG TPA: hypothetical protein EYG07_03270 [Alphaproteobacteria bacterium]|jgi:hypothetical protein|nr:hypothetical protein [Alphaproteobacteria bacterium]
MTFQLSKPDFHNSDQNKEELQFGENIIQKDLDTDIIAEANKNGTIYLDKDIDLNSDKAKEAISHEKQHLAQMNRGDLDYDDDHVYWKGKKYPRQEMNEGSKRLPWEKEAYSKTKKA